MGRMAAEARLTTADEVLSLPHGRWRYELVEGELRRMPLAGHSHGAVAMRVGARLALFVEEHSLGQAYAAETGFLLARAPDTVRAPDAAFVSAARLRETPPPRDGFFPGAPDLAVEVLSPSDSKSRVEEKTAAWLAAGTRAVLIIDSRRQVATVHRPGQDARSFGATDHVTLPDLLPGWSLALDEIFR